MEVSPAMLWTTMNWSGCLTAREHMSMERRWTMKAVRLSMKTRMKTGVMQKGSM